MVALTFGIMAVHSGHEPCSVLDQPDGAANNLFPPAFALPTVNMDVEQGG